MGIVAGAAPKPKVRADVIEGVSLFNITTCT